MAKKKNNVFANLKLLDLFGFVLASIYTQSVLNVAHHTSMWMHDGTARIVDPPHVPSLILGLLVIAYAVHKNKGSVSTTNVISLTIFAIASLFWLSGLRVNFYF